MRSPRRIARQSIALARATTTACRAHRAGPLAVVRRARLLRGRQGFEYEEALGEGLLDPRLPDDEVARHGSRHVTVEAQRDLNPQAILQITGEKAIFYRHFAALGLPVPELFAIFDAHGAGWSRGDRILAGRDDVVGLVRDALPAEAVIKPSDGRHGAGVRVLVREADGFRSADGRLLSAEAIVAELEADPAHDLWIAQERLRNHPLLASLAGDSGLHTLRVATLVGRGGAEVLFAVLRLALDGSGVDNFRQGRSGNAIVSVSPDRGVLGPLTVGRADGCGYRTTPTTPRGVPVEGLVLPGWDAVVDLARECARHALPARTVGWDIALTPDGPRIVEGNMFWWPRFTTEQAGLLARMVAAGAREL